MQKPVEAALRHHVYLSSKQFLQVEDKARLIQQASAWLKFDQKVDVTIFSSFPSDDGTKHPHIARPMLGAYAENLVSLFPE